MSTPLIDHCAICNGTGYLLDQTYGYANPIPEEDWTLVQRCDLCERWADDGDAAKEAARKESPTAEPLPVAYWPGFDDDNGYKCNGDWGIRTAVTWCSVCGCEPEAHPVRSSDTDAIVCDRWLP